MQSPLRVALPVGHSQTSIYLHLHLCKWGTAELGLSLQPSLSKAKAEGRDLGGPISRDGKTED